MEPRKLTKEDIDKVRGIEGFPIAKDEDIIALSDAPYYTACPNPFIDEFIRENGTPYDEATDDYHREPFAADVSEGKNDPIYMAHTYHTKVPYKAIMRYILHYTKPGDIVLDGFCGTGMTGVAAQMCGYSDYILQHEMGQADENWGKRYAILNDLSPAATFIASGYNSPFAMNDFVDEFEQVMTDVEKNVGIFIRQGIMAKQICLFKSNTETLIMSSGQMCFFALIAEKKSCFGMRLSILKTKRLIMNLLAHNVECL